MKLAEGLDELVPGDAMGKELFGSGAHPNSATAWLSKYGGTLKVWVRRPNNALTPTEVDELAMQGWRLTAVAEGEQGADYWFRWDESKPQQEHVRAYTAGKERGYIEAIVRDVLERRRWR